MKEGVGRNSGSSSASAPNSSAPASSLFGLTRPLHFPPLLCLSVSALSSDPFLGLRAFRGLASLFPLMKTVTETPPLPRAVSAQDGTPPLFQILPLSSLLSLCVSSQPSSIPHPCRHGEVRALRPWQMLMAAAYSMTTRGAGARQLHPAYSSITLSVSDVHKDIGSTLLDARVEAANAAKF